MHHNEWILILLVIFFAPKILRALRANTSLVVRQTPGFPEQTMAAEDDDDDDDDDRTGVERWPDGAIAAITSPPLVRQPPPSRPPARPAPAPSTARSYAPSGDETGFVLAARPALDAFAARPARAPRRALSPAPPLPPRAA